MHSDPIRAGVFESEPEADRAVVELLEAGFSEDRISVVSAVPPAPHADHPPVRTIAPSGAHTRRGVLIGGTVGALLWGLAVLVIVVVTGSVGMGPLLGGAMTGVVIGGFIGAMMTRGFEPAIADFHDQTLSEDQYLVAVEDNASGPRLDSAEAVFEHTGTNAVPLPKG